MYFLAIVYISLKFNITDAGLHLCMHKQYHFFIFIEEVIQHIIFNNRQETSEKNNN